MDLYDQRFFLNYLPFTVHDKDGLLALFSPKRR